MVPFHQGRDITPILLRQIAKDIGITLDELLKYRQFSPMLKRRKIARVFPDIIGAKAPNAGVKVRRPLASR